MSKTGTKSEKSTESALAVSGPQPVWMTLNEARERAFTGEVVFEVEPEVLAYLDNGVVYYAERSADVSLGRRLVDAGVLDTSQLERGTVRVGDVEHLGRLFDRDPSVDRDAVLVVAEADTEALVSQLANEAITTVRVTAYRHHPSGVHRWFVGPVEPAANQRPIGEVAQLDTTVVDDLPGLPVASASDAGNELTIEWEESLDGFEELEPLPAIDEFDTSMLEAMLDGGGDVEVEIISDTPDDDIADWDESVEALLDFSTEPDSSDVVQIDPDNAVQEADLEEVVRVERENEADVWIEVNGDLTPADGDVQDDSSEALTIDDLDVDEQAEPVSDDPPVVAEELVFEEILFDDVVVEDVVVFEDVVVVEDVVVFDDVVVEDIFLVEDTLATDTVVEDTVVEDTVVEDVPDEDVPDEVVETAVDEAVAPAVETDTIIEDEESVWEVDTSDDVIDRGFQVVWPDEEDVDIDIEDSVEELAAGEEGDDVEGGPLERENTESPIIQTTSDGLYFEMPELDLSDESIADEDVPDDVAGAVRRAIAAIESAALGSPSIAPIADAGPGDVATPEVQTAPASTGLDAFGPPSMDSSVEVLYSRWEAAAAEAATVSESAIMSTESHGEGTAETMEDGADERSSALRRLIGSLRRKDK